MALAVHDLTSDEVLRAMSDAAQEPGVALVLHGWRERARG
jgi:hypothetical protein